MDEEQKPESHLVEDNSDLPEISFAKKDPEVKPEDMIPEDIDDHIEELPLDEARELYDIYFMIVPPGMAGAPVKDENGFEIRFDSKEEAEKVIAKNKQLDGYVVSEFRTLKPVAGADINRAM